MNRFKSGNPNLLTDCEGTISHIAAHTSYTVEDRDRIARLLVRQHECEVDLHSRFCDLEWLDVVNVCPLLERILNTVVHMASESNHEVIVPVC